MKPDHGKIILLIIGAFMVFMVWSVMTQSTDRPDARTGTIAPPQTADGLRSKEESR